MFAYCRCSWHIQYHHWLAYMYSPIITTVMYVPLVSRVSKMWVKFGLAWRCNDAETSNIRLYWRLSKDRGHWMVPLSNTDFSRKSYGSYYLLSIFLQLCGKRPETMLTLTGCPFHWCGRWTSAHKMKVRTKLCCTLRSYCPYYIGDKQHRVCFLSPIYLLL